MEGEKKRKWWRPLGAVAAGCLIGGGRMLSSKDDEWRNIVAFALIGIGVISTAVFFVMEEGAGRI